MIFVAMLEKGTKKNYTSLEAKPPDVSGSKRVQLLKM
jgi:hypothetical protein